MMKEYRIVKETTTNTKITKYYIEEKKRFLWWKWWDRQRDGDYYYTRLEAARREIDKLTDNIIREVVE